MRTFLRMKNRQTRKLRPEFLGEDLRYPEELVAEFLRIYTRPGDIVLDPFAGYGTTLVVAETMGRTPFGVESDPRRIAYIRSQLQQSAGLIHGDSRHLLDYRLPLCDFSITSPPYMERDDPENPLVLQAGPYERYLEDLRQIYAQVRQVLRPGARAVLEVSNLKGPSGVTTLAWDVARAVSAELTFEGEVVIGWDTYAYGYDHSYCLVFSRS